MPSEHPRISPVIFVLKVSEEEKYYFASKWLAKLKWRMMGNPAYTAPIKTYRFDNKQDLLNFVTGQSFGDMNEYQSITRNNL